ncbi:MAG: 5'/3'-nucleotidase SurE [Flavobacteriaceae bacterium]|jgi:5'-nucleotidase|nr:5'/3'-nucleotidase SurE [Flavobacteriaceae bacterium]
MAKPLILVTNDDGITAPGIRELISIMNELGDVYVVAPNKTQSGMGHAVTINATLHLEKVTIGDGEQQEWSCSGTPVDCVKLAIDQILPKKPDLCVSGINHGSNSSINVLYSGTMSAAMEAGIEGVPSIGFSLCDYTYSADFRQARRFIKSIAENVLKKGLPKGIVLNVNIPAAAEKEIKGIQIARQANAFWAEEFDRRTDPRGRTYYWMTGKWVVPDDANDTDEWALDHNYISVVPVTFDLTAYHFLKELKKWEF